MNIIVTNLSSNLILEVGADVGNDHIQHHHGDSDQILEDHDK